MCGLSALLRTENRELRTSSLPLNRPRRLRSNVIHHPIHAAHFIHNPIRNRLQHFIRQRNPVRRHPILRMHRADGASVSVSPLIAHHANRHHRQEHSKRLPDLLIQPSLLDLAHDDVITLAQQVGAFFSYFAQNANRQSRSRERLTLQNLLRHAKIAPNPPHLVLKQIFQWLNQLELHLLWQSTDVVMRLDHLRWPAHRARFDHVGIERPLHQPLNFIVAFGLNAMCFVIEDFDELVADDLPFSLRINHSRQFPQEAIGGIDRNQVQAEMVTQILLNFLELVLAQYSIVDEYARK